jgi:hypothetical protein
VLKVHPAQRRERPMRGSPSFTRTGYALIKQLPPPKLLQAKFRHRRSRNCGTKGARTNQGSVRANVRNGSKSDVRNCSSTRSHPGTCWKGDSGAVLILDCIWIYMKYIHGAMQ